MIKNNRPYSIENGYIDDGLITSHSEEEIEAVNKWIDENIAPNKKILRGRTSCGIDYRNILVLRYLKHMKWSQISEEMSYSQRWIYKLHIKALSEFGKIIENKTP